MLYPISFVAPSAKESCSFIFSTPSLLSKATFTRLLRTTEDNVSKRYFNPDAISNVTIALPGSNFSVTDKLSTSGSWLNNIQAETPAITTTDAAAIQDNIPLLFTCFLFFSLLKAFSVLNFAIICISYSIRSLSFSSSTNVFIPFTSNNTCSIPFSSSLENSPRVYRNNSFANSNGFFISLVKFPLLQITLKKGLRKTQLFS